MFKPKYLGFLLQDQVIGVGVELTQLLSYHTITGDCASIKLTCYTSDLHSSRAPQVR